MPRWIKWSQTLRHGIPGEEPADDQTVAMMRDLKKAAPGLRLTLGCSTFVPRRTRRFSGLNPQAEKRLQVLQKQLRSHGIDSDQKVTTGQSFRLCYREVTPSHLLELTRHYGDSLGSYRRAFKQGATPPRFLHVHANWSREQVFGATCKVHFPA